MPNPIVACVQLNSQDDVLANLNAIEQGVREAAQLGATLITLPENAFWMQDAGKGYPPSLEAAEAACKTLAQTLKVWLLIGSTHVPTGEGKYWNRSLLIDDRGEIAAQYDKIHLFDATLKNGEIYRESARIKAGDKAIVQATPLGNIGLTICYDVRFPHLHRGLAKAGAMILTVPAAFTYTTGKAHWHTLLRARAIENGCFVIAPAQCGMHPGNRRTYGHSLIVSPWGEVLAEGAEDTPCVITATLDMSMIEDARAMVPSLNHDRDIV